ncbi:MAG: hypothetical protein CMP12_14980 [Zunongwangia sp.]|jgi:uncharacterized protein YpmB|uniref:Uncharacterized protein n=2 Tax=Zunongwangia profunda TaxID=398743 RepID=D5BBN2_ZUNPS|nr:hypothetical protein [Zunongwangia profunda]MAO37176.1 hypothetical protein [Zunongwangia sp.]ADF50466.1 conserved hypothetical protein [Zunongwangia profunda SM-A87]MAS70621.1 hypothetical protein [Zunongwangia sp.]HAJ82415.1 hypothetical protein [Zunongwangia profunda]HCV82307.1 hypothetical protein [Zunongwangia profunda]|tara:strand:+ start:4189 stop:4671 length:483 start_codon:yes stop_codon:yes gene_type:complete
MDTSSTLIGLTLFVLFMGPIFYALYRQGLKERKNKKALQNLAKTNNINLDYTEISNSLVLGLDKTQHKLLILEPVNAMQHQIIDLSEVNKTSVIKRSVTFTEKERRKTKIIQVSIELLSKSNHKRITEILFYDEDGADNNDMETQLFAASRWNSLIQTSL